MGLRLSRIEKVGRVVMVGFVCHYSYGDIPWHSALYNLVDSSLHIHWYVNRLVKEGMSLWEGMAL